jgi:hypothetical protein
LTSISTSCPQLQRAVAQVKARRVGQAHALLHQRARLAQLVGALQFGQLQGLFTPATCSASVMRCATTGTPSATANFTMSVR